MDKILLIKEMILLSNLLLTTSLAVIAIPISWTIVLLNRSGSRSSASAKFSIVSWKCDGLPAVYVLTLSVLVAAFVSMAKCM